MAMGKIYKVKRGGKSFKKKSFKKAVVQAIPRYMKPETKMLFGSIPADTEFVSITGNFTYLPAPICGTSNDERVGDRIRLKSIDMGLDINCPATAQLFRLMVISVKDNNGDADAPVIADILESVKVNSPHDIYKVKRFNIIYDRTFTNSINGLRRYVHIKRKLNMTQHFNETDTGVITAVEKNALYVFTVGSEATGATCAEIHDGRYNLIYTDA